MCRSIITTYHLNEIAQLNDTCTVFGKQNQGSKPIIKMNMLLSQVVVRVRPMNERELFTSDATVVQVDEQDPQQMQVHNSSMHCSMLMSRTLTRCRYAHA